MTRRTNSSKPLMELRKVPGVLAVALVSRDGVVVDDLLPKTVDAKKLAALSAALVGTAETALKEFGRGTFNHSVVEAQEGKILSMGAGEDNLLVALVKPGSNVGLTLMTMSKHASKFDGGSGG